MMKILRHASRLLMLFGGKSTGSVIPPTAWVDEHAAVWVDENGQTWTT